MIKLGEKIKAAAAKHRRVALDDLLEMCVILADYYTECNEKDKELFSLKQ